MSSLGEKLLKLASDESGSWLEDAKYRRENRAWLKKSGLIALKVLNALKSQGLTQNDLADRMQVSPQQISKIVRGHENMTLEAMVHLESTLGINILERPVNHQSSEK